MIIPGMTDSSRRHKRSLKQIFIQTWDPGIFLIAAGLAGAIILAVLVLVSSAEAAAGIPGRKSVVKPSEVREGSLLFNKGADGQYIAAPQLQTQVKIEITGMVAFVRVSQEFENPDAEWLEGIYVFPLPEDSAVNHLAMDVGDRVIEGVVRERKLAKDTYDAAKKEGRKASLLEQELPNIFMVSVANIGPYEKIRVELTYQQSIRFNSNIFSLRFPTVVGPRYIPGPQTAVENRFAPLNPSGWAAATSEVQEAPRFTPPAVEPGQDPVNPVSLEVILDPGFNLAGLKSLYHAIETEEIITGVMRINLKDGQTAADQDFVLEWAPAEDSAVQAALFAQEKDGEHFIYLMVMPPSENVDPNFHIPREVVFVVDVSGSMAGPSIRQARDALAYGISRLQPGDYFNVISFNDDIDKLFQYPQMATGEHISRGLHYIYKLDADGGTDIKPALYEALDTSGNQNRMRQVVFVTDGCVGNEQQLFQTVRQRLRDTRLFTVGIGSAPNSYFMRNIAERGKGTYTYIGDVAEVKTRMRELFRKLENPALTDVRLEDSSGMEMFPDPIPDLYMGEPFTMIARADEVPERFVLSGYVAGMYWQTEISSWDAGKSDSIAILWARQKIKALMDSLDGGVDREQVRREVIATALSHHLVSRYTSIVAVDVTPIRPGYENLKTVPAKTNMPKGWQYNRVFGLPQTATVAELCLVLGGLAMFLALIVWLLLVREKVKVCKNSKF